MLLRRRYYVLVAILLVATSIIAFAPRSRTPDPSSSCRTINVEGISGPRRFTVDSSAGLDLQVDLKADSLSVLQSLETTLSASGAVITNTVYGTTPAPEPGLIRRFKRLLPRADSQDPLV
jgi:hypothetical protein